MMKLNQVKVHSHKLLCQVWMRSLVDNCCDYAMTMNKVNHETFRIGLSVSAQQLASYVKDELCGSYSNCQKRASKILFC